MGHLRHLCEGNNDIRALVRLGAVIRAMLAVVIFDDTTGVWNAGEAADPAFGDGVAADVCQLLVEAFPQPLRRRIEDLVRNTSRHAIDDHGIVRGRVARHPLEELDHHLAYGRSRDASALDKP